MAIQFGDDIFAKTTGELARLMNPLANLGVSNQDPEERALYTRVGNLQKSLAEAGIDPDLQKPRENLFWKTLNFLAKPMQAVEGVVDSALIRQDLGDVGVSGAVKRGWDERITASDMLRRAGVRNPIVRGVAGFATDMALDPLGWMKFGTKGLGTAGGLVLSSKGNKVLKSVEGKFANQLSDFAKKVIAEGGDESATELLRFQQSENLFEGFRALGQASKDAINMRRAPYAAERALYGDKAQKMLALANEKLGVDLGSLDDISDLIAKPSVRFEMGVPFLGHFKGKPSTDLSKLSTKPRKALAAMGNIFKPETIKLGSFEIPGELSEAVARVGTTAREGLARVQTKAIKYLDSAIEANDKNLLGSALSASKYGIEAVTGIGKAIGKALTGTFGRSFLIGESARDAELSLQRRLGALDSLGQDLMLKTFPEIEGEQGRALMKGVAAKVDALAFDVLDTNIDSLGKDIRKNLLENLSTLANKTSLPEGTFDNLDALDGVFRERIEALKATMLPEEASIVDRMVGSFDAMYQQEKAYGIPTKFFEYYLPHRYENLAKVQSLKGKRSFATLGEAWEKANLVGSTDLGSLWFQRWKLSESKIMRGQYKNRMFLEGGFNAEDVQNLWQAARFNPDSTEAAILKRVPYDKSIITKEVQDLLNKENMSQEARRILSRMGFSLDDPLTPSQVAQGKLTAKAQADAIKNFGHITPNVPKKDALIGDALAAARKANPNLPDDLADEIVSSITRFQDESMRAHMESGIRPLASQNPDPWFKEAAGFVDEVVGPGGEKVRHVLPVEIGKALEENLKTKDLLKDALQGSDFGRAALRLMDGTTDMFKRWNTLPWPGYWAQNMFGDSIQRWIDGGISALDPGTMSKTYELLDKSDAVLDLGGKQITGKAFKEFLKRSGLSFEAKDFIDTMNAAGDLNVEAWMRQRGKNLSGHTKSLLKGEAGSVSDAMGAAREFATNNFENFFRVNHVVHRLSMGDTLGDAARNATEAMINYRDFTPIEKSVLRRFYFFYGWTSKAIKKQAISLFTNPGDIMAQVKFARNFAEGFSEPNALPTPEQKDDELMRSVTETEQLAFQLGKSKDGKSIVGRGFGMPLNVPLTQFSLNLPRTWSVSEIVDAGMDNVKRNIQKQAATANPMITVGAELLSGKNLYFDKPLNSKFLRKLPDWTSLAEKIAPFPFSKIPAEALNSAQAKLLGAVPDGKGNYIAEPGLYYLFTHIVPGFGRAISTARTLASPNIPTNVGALRALSGLRIEEADLERSLLFSEREKLESLMDQYSVKERLGE